MVVPAYRIVAIVVYGILCMVASVQGYRLWRSGEKLFSKHVHIVTLLLILTSFFRILSLFTRMPFWDIPSLPLKTALFILPYVIAFSNHTLISFSWISMVHNKGLSKKPLSAFRYRIWFSNFFVVTCFVTLCIFYSTGYIRDSLYYGGIFFALTCACFSSIFLVYGLWLSRKMKRIFGDENYKELGTKTRRGIRHRDGQEQIRKRLEWFAIVLSVFFCLKSGVWISASATGCPSIHKQHCHILYGVFYWCELCVMILNLRLFAPGVDKIVADAKYRRERKNGGKSRKRSPAAVTLRHARNCCDDASEIEDPMEDEETECKSGQCQTESESGDLPSGRERNSQEPLM